MELEAAFIALSALTSANNAEESCLTNHSNPILVSIVSSEFCLKLSTFNLLFREKFACLDQKLRRIAAAIQSQFTEYHPLKVIYLNKGFAGLSLFDLLVRNPERYRCLLNSDLVVSIVEELWSGGANSGPNFHYFTPISAYFDDFGGDLFTVHRSFQPNLNVKSMFQLQNWQKNGNLRLIIETVTLFFAFVIMLTTLLLYLDVIKIIDNPASTYEEFLAAAATLNEILSFTIVYCAVLGMSFLYFLQKSAYKYLQKESILPTFRDLLDTGLCMDSAMILYLNKSEPLQAILGAAETFALNEILFSIMFFLCSIRISVILLQTRLFGPVLRMMYVIIKDVGVFLVLYGLLVFSFTVFFVPLFRRDEEYFGSLQKGFRTLFQWTVSGIDGSIFTYREELGSFLTIVWALVSTILVLNILIAMLSTRYEQLSPQITSDYVSILYHSYKQTRYQAPYGALVMAPPPFNLFHLALVPLYLVWPGSAKRLDRLFVLLSYQVMFAIGSFCFAVYNLMLGFAAFWLALWKVVQTERGRRLGTVLLWFLAGPLYLLYLEVLSFRHFAANMYSDLVEDQGAELYTDIYAPCLKFLESVCATHLTPLILPFADITAVLERFPTLLKAPDLDLQKSAKRQVWAFAGVAARLYGSKITITKAKVGRMKEMFEQFKSPITAQNCTETINLTRMLATLLAYKSNTQALTAFNLAFVLRVIQTPNTSIKG